MQLELEERNLVLKFLNTIYQEGVFDYDDISDFSVLCINGNTSILNEKALKRIKNIIKKLEGEM